MYGRPLIEGESITTDEHLNSGQGDDKLQKRVHINPASRLIIFHAQKVRPFVNYFFNNVGYAQLTFVFSMWIPISNAMRTTMAVLEKVPVIALNDYRFSLRADIWLLQTVMEGMLAAVMDHAVRKVKFLKSRLLAWHNGVSSRFDWGSGAISDEI
jgi:hypothetical protein